MSKLTSIENLKQAVPVGVILRACGSTPGKNGRWHCIFPEHHTHGDADPSVTIHSDTATCWSQRCFEHADIFQLVGLKEGLRDFSEQKRRVQQLAGLSESTGQGLGEIVATYDFTDEHSKLLYQECRFDPKDFRLRRPDGNGGWVWSLGDVRHVFYHLPKLLQQFGSPIIIHEGPGCVDAAMQAGLTGLHTSTCGGSNGVRKTDFCATANRDVVILPDHDEPGEKYLRDVGAMARNAGAKSIKVLRLPDLPPKGDVKDWLQAGGTREAFAALLEQAESLVADGPAEAAVGGFAPISLAQLLGEPEPLEPDWTWEDILAAGILAAIVSKPKVGKSTLIYELAVAVAHGWIFLGRNTKRGNVLILAVEEHRRDVKRRLRNLGVNQPDTIHVYAGPLSDSPDTIQAIAAFIKQHAIGLVIIDTLNSFWSVTDENNAAEVTKAIKPLLQLARDSGAIVLLLHHSRKAEGGHGDEIRGSGALFSLLDVAMILKRDAVDTQRRLTIISRYAESPPELLLELREHGYVSLGDPVKHSKTARLTKLADALTDTPIPVKDLAAKAGVAIKAAYALIETLIEQGKATKIGTGKRGAPFLYSRFVSVAAPKNGGAEETNIHSSPPAQGIPPDPEFVASGVQPLEGETKGKETNAESPGPDSFLPTPVPPGSNESESMEVITDEN